MFRKIPKTYGKPAEFMLTVSRLTLQYANMNRIRMFTFSGHLIRILLITNCPAWSHVYTSVCVCVCERLCVHVHAIKKRYFFLIMGQFDCLI